VALGLADRRLLGRTGLKVSPVCIGTSPLASMPDHYGYEVDLQRAEATLSAVLRSQVNFLDTSNNYGAGAAERYIGSALAAGGGLPPGFVLATKLDADPDTGDFSAERVKRSTEESLGRLGMDRVQLMYLHDPEDHLTFAEAMAPAGPVAAMLRLRDEGVLAHLGVAAGQVAMLRDFTATGAFEVVLCHNRFTLVDRSCEPLIDDAHERGIAFVNAAPYGGGILAQGPRSQPRYCYETASEPVAAAVSAMQRACDAMQVPLAAAALQFSVRDPRVASTVIGISDPSRLDATAGLLAEEIPGELWAELESLTVAPEHWLP
jgi:D-threo-aldose 1-dehydrogenase